MPDENDIIYNSYGVDLVALLEWLREFFRSFFSGGSESGAGAFFNSLGFWWNIYSVIAIVLSLLFLWGFIYAKIRYTQLLAVHMQQIRDEEMAWQQAYGHGAAAENSRWSDVTTHIASENPNDWRLAIIEADIMLEQVLDDAGYAGSTIGDKLKSANTSAFRTVQDAWDAHKVRNQIAHAGSDFVLTKRIAQEVIVKYERVFREFDAL